MNSNCPQNIAFSKNPFQAGLFAYEANPEVATVAASYDLDEVLKTKEARAKRTRELLSEMGLDEKAFVETAGAALGDNMPDNFDFDHDEQLTRVVVGLQAFAGLPKEDTPKGRDGKFGSKTLEAVRAKLRVSKAKEAAAALSMLKLKLDVEKERRAKAEGQDVEHNAIAFEGITAKMITGATAEVQDPSGPDDFEEAKPNLLAIIDVMGKEFPAIPPRVVKAITAWEARGHIDADGGEEIGLGQFVPGTWDFIRKTRRFRGVIGKFTDQRFDTIGRGKSVVAEVLGIYVMLERGVKAMGMDVDKMADVVKDGPREKTKAFFVEMRKFYHMPGYFRVLESGDTTSDKAKRAIAFYKGEMAGYEEWADWALDKFS